jgi:hypothetical protein
MTYTLSQIFNSDILSYGVAYGVFYAGLAAAVECGSRCFFGHFLLFGDVHATEKGMVRRETERLSPEVKRQMESSPASSAPTPFSQ